MAVAKQTLLDNLETAINARLTGGAVQSYSIGGRNVQYMPLSELISFRDRLKAEISQDANQGQTNYAVFQEPT